METPNTTNKRGLVFSMGKVGSSTVMQVFREIGLLPERGFAENLDYLIIYGLMNYVGVVTPVRDPIAHNISRYFEFYGDRLMQLDKVVGTLEAARLCCADDWYPLEWFDNYFKPTFGVDVYAHKFNKTRGWNIIYNRYLLVQTDRMVKVLPDAFEKLFGKRPVVVHRAKTVESRPYGQLYKEFLETVKFPEEQVDKMYSSKFVKHFFTKKQVDVWRQRWTK